MPSVGVVDRHGNAPYLSPHMLGKRRIYPWLLLGWLMLGAACQPPTPEGEESAISRWTELQALLAMPGEYQYEYRQEGELVSTESQHLQISGTDSTYYHYFALYNTFEQEDKTEYFLTEMNLSVHDTVSRQELLEYQLAYTRDSVYFAGGDQMEVKVVDWGAFHYQGRYYPVATLAGYGHVGDPSPGQYKYWSPQFGTLLIWFGESRTYELVATPVATDSMVLDFLRKQIHLRLPKG